MLTPAHRACAGAAGLLLLLPVLGAAQPPNWTAPKLELGIGRVSYEENPSISDIRSEWDAAFVRVGGSVALVPEVHHGLYVAGLLHFDISGTEEETWTGGGGLAQRNDMDWMRTNVRFDMGWFSHLNRGWVLPAGFLGTRFDHFNRSTFFTPEGLLELPPGDVSEDFRLITLGASVEGGWFFDAQQNWSLEGRFAAGWIPLSIADNSLLGSVDGEGGALLEISTACAWRYAPHRQILVGLDVGRQTLDGGVAESFDGSYFVEWPENELTTVALTCAWRAEL